MLFSALTVRRAVSMLCAVAAVVGVASAPVSASVPRTSPVSGVVVSAGSRWVPPTGLLFSAPSRAPFAITNRLVAMLDASPAKSTVTLVSFTVSQPSVVSAIQRAHARGVRVRVLADGHGSRSAPMASLRRTLGTNVSARSWVKSCAGPCRAAGSRGTMHLKAYLFSQVGAAHYVVVTGSANLSGGERSRWNMVRTSFDQVSYMRLMGLVSSMKFDPSNATKATTFWTGAGQALVTPNVWMTRKSDPVAKVLDSTTCAYRVGRMSYRSKVRVMQYAWRGTRGKWIAHAVRDAWNRGCDVQVVAAIMGAGPKSILGSQAGRGPVPLKRAITYRDGRVVRYLHTKALTVSGRRSGVAASTVVQGSFNYSDLGLVSDEFTETYESRQDVNAFSVEFDMIWRELG